MANTAGNIKQQGQETASNLADKAKDAAGNLVDKAKQVAGNVADKARDLASNVGDRVDSGVSSVGKGMESLAGTLRDRGPSSGVLGSATSGIAGAMDSTGHYLEEQGLSGMAEDLTGLIRRHPIPAILIGVGLGYLLARMTRS